MSGTKNGQFENWLPECNASTNTRLENPGQPQFSRLLTQVEISEAKIVVGTLAQTLKQRMIRVGDSKTSVLSVAMRRILKAHANAYAERFVRSIKESCLDRMIFFGEESLRTAIQNFVATITVSAITKA